MRKNELKPCYGTTIAMYKKWNWNKFLFNPNRPLGRMKIIFWAFLHLCHLFWFFLTVFSVV